MKRLLLLVFVLAALAVPAWADFQDGVAAYVRGDYTTALREWKPLAEQGVAAAQFNLGVMYGNGKGVPRDGAEAVKWYRKAAVQGYAVAQLNLGVMYMYGNGGLDKSYVQALKWYILAAEQGNVHAKQNRYELTQGTKYVSGGPPHMTSGMIEEAEKLAREWQPKAE